MIQKQPKILIVDDEKFNLDVLVNLLKANYRTIVAKNGQQALQRLESKQSLPDLVLLDVMMPHMDGFEICRRMKEDIHTKDIPVIFVTALNDVEEETKGFHLGAVDYITKPFSPLIVQARVRTHIELKKNRDLLEILAKEDSLTGIANRRRFDEFLDFEWSRAKRRKNALSLALMDIDYFKKYNDTYGHAAGDECLRKVAATLKGTLQRSTDLIARYGGEEFACIMPDTDGPGAMTVAKRLLHAVHDTAIPHASSDVAEHVSLSIGVTSVIPAPRLEVKAVIGEADRALYLAKKEGRNRVEFA